jgi:hypothetical protein
MRKQILIFAAVIIVVLALVSMAMAADPIVGTWKLNVAKSKVSDPSMMNKSEIITNVAQENGLKFTIDGVDAKGKAYHVTWSGKYDGRDYPQTGSQDVDMTAAKKIDANTFIFMDKKAGKEDVTWRTTVSKDGKVMTIAGKGKDAKGQEWSVTAVYDKQ